MRLQISLGVTVLVSALLASPVYAENCSLSYYCYRSMTPGPAPVTPVATRRPAPNNLQQPRPVTAQAVRPQTNVVRPSTTPLTLNQRLVEQQRAQNQADQQRLAALRRNPPATTSRIAPAVQTPARITTPSPASATFRPIDTQSCSTLVLKVKVLESQATSLSRHQQQAKAQELFRVASDLRKQAQAKSCTI